MPPPPGMMSVASAPPLVNEEFADPVMYQMFLQYQASLKEEGAVAMPVELSDDVNGQVAEAKEDLKKIVEKKAEADDIDFEDNS